MSHWFIVRILKSIYNILPCFILLCFVVFADYRRCLFKTPSKPINHVVINDLAKSNNIEIYNAQQGLLIEVFFKVGIFKHFEQR